MDIYRDGKKIGTLQGATINESEIGGLWIGYYGIVEEELEPFTIKDGNVTYNACCLYNVTGTSNGSHVKFAATSKTVNPIQKRKQSKLIPSR